jgi:hypothetical protein
VVWTVFLVPFVPFLPYYSGGLFKYLVVFNWNPKGKQGKQADNSSYVKRTAPLMMFIFILFCFSFAVVGRCMTCDEKGRTTYRQTTNYYGTKKLRGDFNKRKY